MDVFQQGIITLLQSALTENKPGIPDLDYSQVYAFGARHHITNLLFYGIVASGVKLREELNTRFFLDTCSSISIDQLQLSELHKITEAFEKCGIDYMPLKGSVMKCLYPNTDMRVMGDIDILIRLEQYEIIRPLMQDLGYEEIHESNNELVWDKPPLVRIELHKSLFPTTHKDYFTYFADVWKSVKKYESSRRCYCFADEDQLIYLFTHFADHYRNGGIGIRHMVDLYVYISKNPSIEVTYIKSELTRLQLYAFYQNILRTLYTWFNNEPSDEMTDFITNKVFVSGAFGTPDSRLTSATIKDSKSEGSVLGFRIKKLFFMVFLPYELMCELYKILRKYPVLLPIMWIFRWGNVVFSKRDSIKKRRAFLKIISTKNFENYRRELEYVGLNDER